jgi:uncharacterized membrane-anchored protein
MKAYILVVFLVLCGAQWYVPFHMIAEQENLHDEGRVFRFKTEPVDPSDPFRGKYITLSFEADTFSNAGEKWLRGETIFVTLEEDQDGFASIVGVSREAPEVSVNYVKAVVAYGEDPVHIQYPFDKFYMEESKAKPAENVYLDANRNDSTQVAYAIVHVKDGNAALSDVIIDDRSIVDIVRELNATQP